MRVEIMHMLSFREDRENTCDFTILTNPTIKAIMESATSNKQDKQNNSYTKAVIAVLLTVAAQYAIIVFLDHLREMYELSHYGADRTGSLLIRPLVHLVGCLISWLTLCRNKNPQTVSLASWLLTVIVALSFFCVRDLRDLANAFNIRQPVFFAHEAFPPVVLLITSVLVTCTTQYPRYSFGVCLALLDLSVRSRFVRFDSVQFWLLCGILALFSTFLDEISCKFVKQSRLLIRAHAYWIGLVAFGALWLRQIDQWLDGRSSSASAHDAFEVYVWIGVYAVSLGYCLFKGLRNGSLVVSYWRFGIDALRAFVAGATFCQVVAHSCHLCRRVHRAAQVEQIKELGYLSKIPPFFQNF
jgi:hypothetical protein